MSMKGGKTYRAYINNSTLQDTLCIYKDTKTFCKFLASSLDKVQSVRLFYSPEGNEVLNKDDAHTFLITLTNSNNRSITTTFTDKKVFLKHIDNVASVKQIIDETYHPFLPVVKGKAKQSSQDVVGFSIEYKSKSTFHTFQQVCDDYVDNMKLSNAEYTKMVNDISGVIDKVQRKGFCINGISHHTLGYYKASNSFKILDWQYMNTVASKKHDGYLLYSHPLKTYMSGATSMRAKRNMSLGSLLPKNRWVRRLETYNTMNAYSKASLMYIFDTYKKKEYLNFVPYFDRYALALVSIFIAEKNNIQAPSETISKWMSVFTPNATKINIVN